MVMDSVQMKASAYQGSVTEKAQPAPEATNRRTEVRKTEQPDFSTTKNDKDVADENSSKPTDKIVTPEQASDSSLKKAVEDINRQSPNTEAIFGYHEGTKRVTIKIVDKDTKEVKKEYPAEETLDMIQRVWEMAGLMVDEKR